MEAQDVIEGSAHSGELRRQCQDFAELAVPADKMQLLVEHRDALAHMVKGGL